MSLLTGFNISLDEVGLLGQASQAAFVGGNIPFGWTVVRPAQLGLGSQYSDGNYFTDPTSGASAIVLKKDQEQGPSSYIVAFRGADDPIDILHNPELLTGSYIHHYDPLLNALSAIALSGADFAFTGASLGGAATNLMANIAGSAFGGAFAGATFVGFASLNISTASGILNLWFENDPVYKSINGYADFSSSLDNFVLATSQYMGGNYNGLLPPDLYAHDLALGFDALSRLSQSVFYDVMTPDSVVIFDANDGLVQDVTPGRENTGAFYLGEAVADQIIGRAGNDFIEGFAGDDTLNGGAGGDAMAGGPGNDVFFLDTVGDLVIERPGEGVDSVWANVTYTLPAEVEYLMLYGAGYNGTGNALTNIIYGTADDNILAGLAGDDQLNGREGADWLIGGDGNDVLSGDAGNDSLQGDAGNDVLIGGPGNDTYFVDNPGDTAIENPGAGSDAVIASVNFTIPTNVEVLYENGSGLTGTGSSGNDYLASIGANTLIGSGGDDTFVFLQGQSNGTTIMDFNGNGPNAGDNFQFIGDGTAAQEPTLTQVDPTHWSINWSDGLTHDIITLWNGADVHQSDFLFV
jgi:hypothetical protein